MRILIVDDEQPARDRLSQLIRDSGQHEVVAEAGNGKQAIELAEELRPDVVLPEARAGHTATNLDEGRVLFTGGVGPEGPDNLSSAFMFVSD